MENKKINIAEILKDCPPGMELDCTLYNTKVIYQGLNKRIPTHPIVVQTEHGFEFELTQYGQIHNIVGSKCVIFPKDKTTWEGFVPPCKFKDGDILFVESVYPFIVIYKENENEECFYKYVAIKDYPDCTHIFDGNEPLCHKKGVSKIRFATKEEKRKLFDAIKENGYRWNADTKILEKIVEPKFKVGDVIQDNEGYKVEITEVNIDDECYGYRSKIANGLGCISFKDQDNWELISDEIKPKFKVGDKVKRKNVNYTHIVTITEIDGDYYGCVDEDEQYSNIYVKSAQDKWKLVPNKFDINTLVSFESKVLVRDSRDDMWRPAIFGCFNGKTPPYYVLGGIGWKYCIPYEGNEHLLGKTDDCKEFYKTW